MNPGFEKQLNRWMEGDLSESEAASLRQMLIEDPDARRVYYELLMLDRLLGESSEALPKPECVMESITRDRFHRRLSTLSRTVWVTGIAAVFALAAFISVLFMRQTPVPGETASYPQITGSTDSRITVAQRQDASLWSIGELLRLERGSADFILSPHVTANVEGPAAIELLDRNGSIQIFEGMASVNAGNGGGATEIRVPGGTLRNLSSRHVVEVLPDGVTQVRIDSGLVEVRPRGGANPIYLKGGDALLLESDGTSRPIRLPDHDFRSGLPQRVVLFRDEFAAADGTSLASHIPSVGGSWKVLSELNPTLIRNRCFDTSSGSRRVVAELPDHGPQGSRAVYIFTFNFQPPQRIQDKVTRLGGIEQVKLQDRHGNDIAGIIARAVNNHRWQLADERTKATSPLTPVCALWTHSLTLCYDLNGLVTLHDGASAQAPIIAEIRVAHPAPVARLFFGNFDGGDLTLSRVEALLLPAVPDEL